VQNLGEAVALRDRLRPRSLPAVQMRQTLALALQDLGRSDEARQRLREADEILAAIGAGRSWLEAQSLARAQVAKAAGNAAEAERQLEGLAALADIEAPPPAIRGLQARLLKAALDLELQRPADAERRLRLLGVWLDAEGRREALPGPDITWRLLCARLLRGMADGAALAAATAHDAAARQLVLRHQHMGSVLGRVPSGAGRPVATAAGLTPATALAACPLR
jgi:hypothetical protein